MISGCWPFHGAVVRKCCWRNYGTILRMQQAMMLSTKYLLQTKFRYQIEVKIFEKDPWTFYIARVVILFLCNTSINSLLFICFLQSSLIYDSLQISLKLVISGCWPFRGAVVKRCCWKNYGTILRKLQAMMLSILSTCLKQNFVNKLNFKILKKTLELCVLSASSKPHK